MYNGDKYQYKFIWPTFRIFLSTFLEFGQRKLMFYYKKYLKNSIDTIARGDKKIQAQWKVKDRRTPSGKTQILSTAVSDFTVLHLCRW